MPTQAQIASFLKGKDVVLVGPAASLKGSKQGERIDNADVVVRVNLGCPVPPDMREDIGSRTDILYHVLFGRQHHAAGFQHTMNEIAEWKAAGVQFLVTRHVDSHPRVRAVKMVLGNKLPIIPMTQAFVNRTRRDVGGARSPNTGVMCIKWLLDMDVKSLYVTGFDFYASGYHTGYGGFDEKRAAQGVGGKGMWGEGSQVPHPQEPQMRYLEKLYWKDDRLSFDSVAIERLRLNDDRRLRVTALVPMKEHSERVPNKNIRRIAGRPLYSYMLTTLMKANKVGTIIVDTDSTKIAEMVHQEFKSIKVVLRPEELHGDEVTANTLIEWELTQARPEQQHFLFCHVTSPLLRYDTIDAAVESYFQDLDSNHDSLFGVTEHHVRLFDESGKPIGHDPTKLMRTQDLTPLYEDNSSMYLFSRTSFERAGGRIGHNPKMFPVPKSEAVDIDTEEDFKIAAALLGWKGQ